MKAAQRIELDLFRHSLANPPAPVCPVDPHVDPRDRKRLTGQNLAVLRVMLTGLAVTPDWGRGCGINRLAARIHDLREAGVTIQGGTDPKTREAVYVIPPANIPAARRVLEEQPCPPLNRERTGL